VLSPGKHKPKGIMIEVKNLTKKFGSFTAVDNEKTGSTLFLKNKEN
jgi:hypothetical protein